MLRRLIIASTLAATVIWTIAISPAKSQYYSHYAAHPYTCDSDYDPYCALYDYPFATYYYSGHPYDWGGYPYGWGGYPYGRGRYWRDRYYGSGG